MMRRSEKKTKKKQGGIGENFFFTTTTTDWNVGNHLKTILHHNGKMPVGPR
jgi:hypothetical protein